MELDLDRSTYSERTRTFDGAVRKCRLEQEVDKNGDPRFFHDDCGYDRAEPYGSRFSCGEDAGCQKDEPMISLHWEVERDDGRCPPWRDDGCEEWKVPYSTKPRGQSYHARPLSGGAFDREQAVFESEFERLGAGSIETPADFEKVVGNRARFEVVKIRERYYYRFQEILD